MEIAKGFLNQIPVSNFPLFKLLYLIRNLLSVSLSMQACKFVDENCFSKSIKDGSTKQNHKCNFT